VLEFAKRFDPCLFGRRVVYKFSIVRSEFAEVIEPSEPHLDSAFVQRRQGKGGLVGWRAVADGVIRIPTAPDGPVTDHVEAQIMDAPGQSVIDTSLLLNLCLPYFG